MSSNTDRNTSLNLRQRFQYLSVWVTVDVFIIVMAYGVVYLSRVATVAQFNVANGLPMIGLTALLTVAALYVAGVYQRLWFRTSGHSVMVIVYGVATGALIGGALDLAMTPRPLPISVFIFGSVVTLAGLVAARYRSRLFSGLSWRWKAIWLRQFPTLGTRTIIVGAGESGQDLVWRMEHRFPENDYRIIGFIDDDKSKHHMYVEGRPVLGGRNAIIDIVRDQQIELIIMAIHNIAGSDFREILAICEKTDARIKVVPDVFNMMDKSHNAVPLRDILPEDLLGRKIVSRHKAVDLNPVMKKRILITGAAGSIGSELSRQIMDYEPVQVILADNNESGLHDLVTQLQTQHPRIEMIPILVDITVHHALQHVFQRYQPQIIFHAAAYKHVPMMELYPQEALRVNIKGTLNLAEMAVTHQVERFVLVSTDKAVHPSNIMGASKRAGELLLHAFSQEDDCQTLFTAVRFGNVLGSRGSVIPTFNRQIDNGGPVTVTHPEMTRYFMSIPEAANLIIHAACLTEGDEIFVLKMGEVVRILDLAERMIRLRGLRPHKDIKIDFTGVRPGEKMHEELFYQSENPTDTLHPNIVQLNNWPVAFDRAEFFDRLVQIVVQDSDSTSEEVLLHLQQLIEAQSTRATVNGKVSESL